jgi:hypothetical protein
VIGEKKKDAIPNQKRAGEFLHTKHAFPPNNLGNCGPDTKGRILNYLHNHANGIDLQPALTKFEAAYPFVRMIAKSTGKVPFDYQVAEAYWIGNSLLDRVEPAEFFEFSYGALSESRMNLGDKGGLSKVAAKSIFRKVGRDARPHHTFYVLGMYARSSIRSGSTGSKLVELMDSCRISWGRVLEAKKDTLLVNTPSLKLKDGKLSLSHPARKEIRYDPLIPPFSEIRAGDWVTIHWNFASERLQSYQLANLKRYTALDIKATNELACSFNE